MLIRGAALSCSVVLSVARELHRRIGGDNPLTDRLRSLGGVRPRCADELERVLIELVVADDQLMDRRARLRRAAEREARLAADAAIADLDRLKVL